MWLITFLYACIVVIQSVSSQNNTPAFRKCCPKDQSLVKVTVLSDAEDQFQCVNSDTAKQYFNISKFTRLIFADNILIYDGIPANCSVIQIVMTNVSEQELKSEYSNFCYDKKIANILNGTIQEIPQTVALVCDELENKTKALFKIDRIRKCCPEGRAYDLEYHTCRDVYEENIENSSLKWLQVKNNRVYDMDIGLHCRVGEFAIELTERQFTLEIDGSILQVNGKKGRGKVQPGNFCIDRDFQSSMLVARVCTADCSQFGAYCLRKCCPIGHHYKPFTCSSFRSVCVPDEGRQLFDITSYLEDLKNDYDDAVDVIGMGINVICPDKKFGLNNSEARDQHWLTLDGRLVGKGFEYDKFCLETFDWRGCSLNNFETSAIGCFWPDVKKNFHFAAVTNMLSAGFLLVTVVVYCCLPELQSLHRRTVICHSATMLVAYSCLARVQFARVHDPVLCRFLGYGIYFGFVAAFFWLNVMCFDIWWTFGNIRSVQMLRKSNSERRRFVWYSLYAWGVTLLLTGAMLLLDVYHVADEVDANIGRDHCWFSSEQNMMTDWPHYIFFVVPMGIVTSANLILWMLTARHCARVKSEVHRLQSGSVGDRAKRRFQIDRAKYLLTGKLWVVMGAGWISELISTLFSEPYWLWAAVDLINELQGVFIFLLLVFKPKVYNLIKKRMGLVNGEARKNETSSSGRTSSSFLSRIVSSDERDTQRTSVPNHKHP